MTGGPPHAGRLSGSFSAAVLAWGEAGAGGGAWTDLDGRPVIVRLLELLRGLFEDVWIVTRTPSRYVHVDAAVVADVVEAEEPVSGIVTALLHAREDACFVAACDMPFLDPEVIRRLADHARSCDIVVPVVGGEAQAAHAFYARRCLPRMRGALRRGVRGAHALWGAGRVLRLAEDAWRDLDPENRCFWRFPAPAPRGHCRGDAGPHGMGC